jgi:penicillin-binding protein 1A
LEARYGKNEILELYVNHIFLGAGAYGVQSAARRYFDKDVSELDVGEMALIAGMAQAPSRTSPLVDLGRARRRRDQVLRDMVSAKVIAPAEAERWIARPVLLRPRRDLFRERSPYFAEHVRRLLTKKYGMDALLQGGYRIDTTVRPDVDVAAQENVEFSARKVDKRQGWRGPEAHLEGDAAREEFVARSRKLYGSEPLRGGHLYLALVEQVDSSGARLRIGARPYELPLANLRWAAAWSARDATNDRTIANARSALTPGDVVWVSPEATEWRRRFSDWKYEDKGEPEWLAASDKPEGRANVVKLEQVPRVQGLLYTFDHRTGYVQALAGGTDYDRSEFNRVTQACRQPGSSFKPIYYSLALDRGYSYGTELNDIPKAEVDPVTGEVWVPTNIGNTVDYQVSLEYALVWSKNIPSVELFSLLGAREVEKWARRLGLTTPIIADKALALGASCVRPEELARAFSLFARNGRWVEPVYIRRVTDRDGRVLEDHSVAEDPFQEVHHRLDRFFGGDLEPPRQAISERTAWLTAQLLRRAIEHGHASVLRATQIPAAGKTGTSSATMDVWFAAFTSRWLTTAWLGDDQRERPLGYKDAAFMLAVPMWARYMNEVIADQPLAELPVERPSGVRPHDIGGPLHSGAAPSESSLRLPSSADSGERRRRESPPRSLDTPPLSARPRR